MARNMREFERLTNDEAAALVQASGHLDEQATAQDAVRHLYVCPTCWATRHTVEQIMYARVEEALRRVTRCPGHADEVDGQEITCRYCRDAEDEEIGRRMRELQSSGPDEYPEGYYRHLAETEMRDRRTEAGLG